MSRSLAQLPFDDLFVRSFPADPLSSNVPRQVQGALYSLLAPTPVRQPRLVAWSDEAAALLGVDRPAEAGPEAEALGGNRTFEGMKPYASCYGGHQFGHWAGQLGDGRAITLGEAKGWEIQLKGPGRTPYSRRGDGRAVLRSSIREFLCSEIMHFLGVPTTRALSLVVTGDDVMRDMFYNGRPEFEPGAICSRLSPSFLRFGHYEILASRGEAGLLGRLTDFTIDRYFPELEGSGPARTLRWFEEVCRRTALLMVEWMRVGFVHGVMNTDNMSILGLTIDYGPYGWVDVYDPGFTPNTTDSGGRYAFGRQGAVGAWNLERLGLALVSLVPSESDLEAGLELYAATFREGYRKMLAAKLGLNEADDAMLSELTALLRATETDMTLFFRSLSSDPGCEDAFYREPDRERLGRWLTDYAAQVARESLDPAVRKQRMNSVNPRIIPRNYLVQQVIDRAESGDYAAIEEMLEAFRKPYDDGPPDDPFEQKRPDWARNAPGCSALSCSS